MTAAKGTLTMTKSSARFWNRMADRYSRSPISDEDSYQKRLQMTREHLRPDMKVLEFGCGTGSTALAHAPLVDRITAIDISRRMIEIAQGKATSAGVQNVEFSEATLDDFAAPDDSYDVVLGLNILHLLSDRTEAIARVHALLNTDGVFISSTPCLAETMKFFKLLAPLGRAVGLLPMLRVFTKQELMDSIAAGGFHIDEQWSPSGGKKRSLKAVFIVARKIG